MKKIQVIEILGALAQETRLDIFRLLVRAGGQGMAAGNIAAKLKLPPATCSFHLKELKTGRAVTSERDGRSLIYRANFPVMLSLLDYLTEHCCEAEKPRGAR